MPTVVYSQDDPSFPSTAPALDDSSLESSFAFDVEAVPTSFVSGRKEVARTFGWNRSDWEKLTGLKGSARAARDATGLRLEIGEPGVYDALRAKYGSSISNPGRSA